MKKELWMKIKSHKSCTCMMMRIALMITVLRTWKHSLKNSRRMWEEIWYRSSIIRKSRPKMKFWRNCNRRRRESMQRTQVKIKWELKMKNWDDRKRIWDNWQSKQSMLPNQLVHIEVMPRDRWWAKLVSKSNSKSLPQMSQLPKLRTARGLKDRTQALEQLPKQHHSPQPGKLLQIC